MLCAPDDEAEAAAISGAAACGEADVEAEGAGASTVAGDEDGASGAGAYVGCAASAKEVEKGLPYWSTKTMTSGANAVTISTLVTQSRSTCGACACWCRRPILILISWLRRCCHATPDKVDLRCGCAAINCSNERTATPKIPVFILILAWLLHRDL